MEKLDFFIQALLWGLVILIILSPFSSFLDKMFSRGLQKQGDEEKIDLETLVREKSFRFSKIKMGPIQSKLSEENTRDAKWILTLLQELEWGGDHYSTLLIHTLNQHLKTELPRPIIKRSMDKFLHACDVNRWKQPTEWQDFLDHYCQFLQQEIKDRNIEAKLFRITFPLPYDPISE